MKKNNSGITLIALIISIVLMLILATVTLNIVLGDNGIISKAKSAKKNDIIGKEKEVVGLVYTDLSLGQENYDDYQSLINSIKNKFSEYGYETNISFGRSDMAVYFVKSGNQYSIDMNTNEITYTDLSYKVNDPINDINGEFIIRKSGKITYQSRTMHYESIKGITEYSINTNLEGKNLKFLDFGYVIDNNGKIYKFEPDTNQNEYKLVEEETLKGKKIIQYVKCLENLYLVDDNGTMYSYGINYYGQLGNGNTSEADTFQIVNIPNEKIIKVDAFDPFLCYIYTESGKVYGCGYNDNGEISLNANGKVSVPICLNNGTNLQNVNIKEIKYNNDKVFALDDSGKVYSWGENYGKLGNGSTEEKSAPICISNNSVLNGKVINQLYMFNNNKTYAIDNNGIVYDISDETINKPKNISEETCLSNKFINKIYCNYNAYFAIDTEGNLYSWGNNEKCMLGIGDENEAINSEPQVLNNKSPFDGEKIKDIFFNNKELMNDKIYAIGENGNIYAWGLEHTNDSIVKISTPICYNKTEGNVLNGKNIKEFYSFDSRDIYGFLIDSENKIYSIRPDTILSETDRGESLFYNQKVKKVYIDKINKKYLKNDIYILTDKNDVIIYNSFITYPS